MFGHWYVIAGRAQARFFTETESRDRLKLVGTLKNPLAQARRRDLLRKQEGLSFRSSGRTGTFRSARPLRSDPLEEAASQFAREITKFLDQERKKKKFESLTIAAEPKFMGKIRAHMKAPTERRVLKWLRKDLDKQSIHELGVTLF